MIDIALLCEADAVEVSPTPDRPCLRVCRSLDRGESIPQRSSLTFFAGLQVWL